MFAVFSKETALPPTGLLSPIAGFYDDWVNVSPEAVELDDLDRRTRRSFELKRHCADTLASIHHRHSQSRRIDLGDGNGFNFFAGPVCHYALRKHVSCLFAGDVPSWPGRDRMAENHHAFVEGYPEEGHDMASWLLTFYDTFHNMAFKGIMDEALRSLDNIQGSFAFIIYDGKNHRVLAARDRNGRQPLFWGATPDGRLLFSSDLADLAECNPSATAFPAGSMFLSECRAKATQPGPFGWTIDSHVVPGEVLSFVPSRAPLPAGPFRGVKAVPRVTSKGCLCGAVYRVASESNVAAWGQSH